MLSDVNIGVPIVKPLQDLYVMDNEQLLKELKMEKEEKEEYKNETQSQPVASLKPVRPRKSRFTKSQFFNSGSI